MSQWITVWGQAHTDISRFYSGKRSQTVRIVLTIGAAGSGLRLRFGNHAGNKPMHLSAVTVKIGNHPIQPILFSGKSETTLCHKDDIYSDPLPISIVGRDDATISMAFDGYFSSGNTPNEVIHLSKKGNYAHCSQMPLAGKNINELLFGLSPVLPALTSVEVLTNEAPQVVVCIGNSITQQGQWTNPLRNMLLNAGHSVQIVNKGIGGNRLISDALPEVAMYGQSAISRFQRDVVDQPGVTAVIIEEGTNDLNMAKNDVELAACDAAHLAEAFSQLATIAKDAGLKVYIATVTPRGGTKNWSEKRETERLKLNAWIRSCSCIDGVLDYDAVTRDSQDPGILAPACDSGDHLHPGPIGGLRMAREAFHVLTNPLD